MCRSTISIGWMGEVFDCDFNQMLKMQVRNGKPLYLWDVTPERLEGWEIQTGVHCLACTAGGGSSCTGAMDNAPDEGLRIRKTDHGMAISPAIVPTTVFEKS